MFIESAGYTHSHARETHLAANTVVNTVIVYYFS